MQYGKRWEGVRTAILDDIETNQLQPGAKLPNDVELGARFGVNRHTVRHAIKALEVEGLLRVSHGRGTFVTENPTSYLLHTKTRLTENLLGRGHLARRKILKSSVVQGDARLNGILQLAADGEVLCVETLSFQDEIPRNIAFNYFPSERVPGLLGAFSGINSITNALSAVGITDFSREWIKIDARMPTEPEAALLGMSMAAPVFVQENLDSSEGRPIKYGYNVSCASRVTLTVDFSALREATARAGHRKSA